MNRHHPYATVYESPRRGGSPASVGPDRNYSRYSERGGPPRGRGRGRGGGTNSGNMYSNGASSYDQAASPTGYEANTSDAYGQWNTGIPQEGYFGQTNAYGDGDSNVNPYGSPPGGFESQDYGSYEEGPSSFRGRGRGRGRGNARREKDDKVHDSIIEERIQRERPCRTLFIRNIKYETDSTFVRRKFDEYGEIKTFFDLIANRGMVFVTYFDLRAAERARERLQDMEISGRPIDVHYSLPRQEDINNKDERDRNQGTVLVTLRNSNSGQGIDENELRRKLQQCGDIKSIKLGENPHNQRYVEFFDTRACEDAYDRVSHQPFQDGTLDIAFSWDIPDVPLPPGPIPQKREERPAGRDPEESTRGRRGGRGGRGRGRGSGPPPDDWERREEWGRDRDRDRPNRRYEEDFARGRGGYNEQYEDRSGAEYSVPPPPSNYAAPPAPQRVVAPLAGYGPLNGAAPLGDDRLDQARKVQQLLAALKQPQGTNPTPNTPPTPAPSSSMPPAGPPNPPSYYPPPTMQQPPYAMGGVPPPNIPNPYAQSGATSATSQQGMPPSLAGLPPNILALLQQASQQGHMPGGQPLPPQFGMPPMPGMPPPPAGGMPQPSQPGYQQLMSYLSQAGKTQ